MNNEATPLATVYLAKALHYANQSAACFESVITEAGATQDAKKFLQNQADRVRKAVTDVKLRLRTKEMRDVITREMKDQYRIDAFVTQLMLLNEDGWAAAEGMLGDLISKGEFKLP